MEMRAQNVAFATVEISVPEEMSSYVAAQDEQQELLRNALLLLPHIKSLDISHGKAAQMLGIDKQHLIALYGKLGIPYLDMSPDELAGELEVFERAAGRTV